MGETYLKTETNKYTLKNVIYGKIREILLWAVYWIILKNYCYFVRHDNDIVVTF